MAQIATTEADRTAAVTARRETIPASATDVPADLPNKLNRTLHLIEKTAATAKDTVGTGGRMATSKARCCPPPRRGSR